jgi:hypothetical protein
VVSQFQTNPSSKSGAALAQALKKFADICVTGLQEWGALHTAMQLSNTKLMTLF